MPRSPNTAISCVAASRLLLGVGSSFPGAVLLLKGGHAIVGLTLEDEGAINSATIRTR